MRFEVENMSCDHCVRAITRAIHAIDPEAGVNVSPADGTVDIAGLVTAADAIKAMGDEGYPARQMEGSTAEDRDVAVPHIAAAQ